MSLYRILGILTIIFSFSMAACPDGTEVCLSLADVAEVGTAASADFAAASCDGTDGWDGTEEGCTTGDFVDQVGTAASADYYPAYTGLNYVTTVALAGFQFDHNGCVTSVSGGDAADAFDGISVSSSVVLAFSFSGTTVLAGSGTMLELYGDEISITCMGGNLGSGYCIEANIGDEQIDDCWQWSDSASEPLTRAWDGSDCMDNTTENWDGSLGACNYNGDASLADDSLCEFPAEFFDCDGTCIVVDGGTCSDDTSADQTTCEANMTCGDASDEQCLWTLNGVLDANGLDCSGLCGGTDVLDVCGDCAGSGVLEACDCEDTSMLNADGCCDAVVMGCDDVCASGLVDDICGECNGTGVDGACDCEDTSQLNADGCCDAVVADCAGVCDGSGIINTDGDGECCGSAVIDCANVCDGSGVINTDGDGECCGSAVIDCANVCDGTSAVDVCGECGGTVTDENDCPESSNDGFLVYGLELSNIFPNPFNPSTTVEFSVMNAGAHKIDIYSTSGKLIETISEGYVSPGSYQVTWNANDMPSGIYIIRLITNGKLVDSRKVMLLK